MMRKLGITRPKRWCISFRLDSKTWSIMICDFLEDHYSKKPHNCSSEISFCLLSQVVQNCLRLYTSLILNKYSILYVALKQLHNSIREWNIFNQLLLYFDLIGQLCWLLIWLLHVAWIKYRWLHLYVNPLSKTLFQEIIVKFIRYRLHNNRKMQFRAIFQES